jgi:hypothetical protein
MNENADVEGLQKRADELMVAAALRVHGGYPVQGELPFSLSALP